MFYRFVLDDIISLINDDSLPIFYRDFLYKQLKMIIERRSYESKNYLEKKSKY